MTRFSSCPVDQQNFDVEKRLTESQEQFLSTARDLQTVKEENSRLSQYLTLLLGLNSYQCVYVIQ